MDKRKGSLVDHIDDIGESTLKVIYKKKSNKAYPNLGPNDVVVPTSNLDKFLVGCDPSEEQKAMIERVSKEFYKVKEIRKRRAHYQRRLRASEVRRKKSIRLEKTLEKLMVDCKEFDIKVIVERPQKGKKEIA